MYRNMLALAAIVAMQAITLQAHAVTLCTAGNPNTTSVAESTPTSAFVDHNDGTVTMSNTSCVCNNTRYGINNFGTLINCIAGVNVRNNYINIQNGY